jgi:hypothetical protein
MDRRSFVASLVLTVWMPFPFNRKIDQVIVRDVRNADSSIVRTIVSAEELESFRALWSTRKKLPPDTPMHVQYKFTILSGGRSDSWLYDPSGLTQVLTKARTPVYRLPSPEAFNRLIGAGQSAPAQ